MPTIGRAAARARRALVLGLLPASLLLAATALEAQPLTGLAGETLDPEELDRGVQIVVSWASWSPRCRDIVARVNALADRWGGRARVTTLNFQEDAGTVRSFLAGQRMRAPVFLDREGALSKKLAVTHLPGLLVLVDGREKFNGRLPSEPDEAIEQALGG